MGPHSKAKKADMIIEEWKKRLLLRKLRSSSKLRLEQPITQGLDTSISGIQRAVVYTMILERNPGPQRKCPRALRLQRRESYLAISQMIRTALCQQCPSSSASCVKEVIGLHAEIFKGSSVDDRLKFVRKRGHMAVSCLKVSFCQFSYWKLSHREHSTFSSS